VDLIETYGILQLALLGSAAFLAALVRGFSGFGSALVYLPIAAQVLTPFQAITTIVIFDLIGPLPLVRQASRDCDVGDLVRLLAGLILALPLGLLTLTLVAPEVFRFTVSFVALFMLASLISGFRYRGQLSAPLIFATGGMSGFLQGVAGLPGPPVILLYMASALSAQAIRANTFLFLLMTDVVLLPALALFGKLDPSAIILGLALIIPTLAGSVLGARIFRPGYERMYRGVAYAIIAASALSGLPLWG
jgi:uncharacterized membrane protein YfcA